MTDNMNLNLFLNVNLVDKFTKPFNDLIQTTKKGVGLFQKQIEGIGKTKKMMSEMNKTSMDSIDLSRANQNALTQMFTGVSTETAGFGDVLNMSQDSWAQFNKQGLTFSTRGGKLANKFRMMTHGLRGFRMEMLGVMFFGMAMSRMFSQMLKPAAENLGIFDLWSETLGLIFLPIMLALLPMFLELVEYLMTLPDGVKMALGVFALLGLILGKVIMWAGMLALGLGSLAQSGLLAPLLTGLKGFMAFLGGIGAVAATIFAVVVALIIGFVLAWKENFGNIKEWVGVMWEGIKNIFGGAFDFISNIFKAFVDIFKGDWDGFKEHIVKAFKGLGRMILGIIQFVLGLVVTIGLSAFRLLMGIVKFIWNGLIDYVQWQINIWIKLLNKLIGVANKIPRVNIKTIGEVDFSGAQIGDFGATFADARSKSASQEQGNNIEFAPTYNVNVADKAEFERLLADNDRKNAANLARNV